MEPSELLQTLVGFLESAGIPYLVTGSMATIAYGDQWDLVTRRESAKRR